jgi:hypothetical protein
MGDTVVMPYFANSNREKEASREDILFHKAVTTLPVFHAISDDATYCRTSGPMRRCGETTNDC